LAALAVLEQTLKKILPKGYRVVVFGSVLVPGQFDEHSDIDLALDWESNPDQVLEERELTRLAVALEESLGRPVDLLNLASVRPLLREKIRRQGAPWTV
jgi:predicted nucleotidyltransferase